MYKGTSNKVLGKGRNKIVNQLKEGKAAKRTDTDRPCSKIRSVKGYSMAIRKP